MKITHLGKYKPRFNVNKNKNKSKIRNKPN